MKVYIAGKVSGNSSFKKHDWRDEFCDELCSLSGLALESLDQLKIETSSMGPWEIFAKDCYLISQSDVVVVYLSDDISIGGSQEILIAKYLQKPVIGLAPFGGKFNGSSREFHGKLIKDWQDPFVFSTCDIVCRDTGEVASAIQKVEEGQIKVRTIDIIDRAVADFEKVIS